jgi:hypothetical protein
MHLDLWKTQSLKTMAITGSTPNILTVFAVIIAILRSAVGSIFMAVSDKNIGPRFVNIIFVVATIDALSFTDKLQHRLNN